MRTNRHAFSNWSAGSSAVPLFFAAVVVPSLSAGIDPFADSVITYVAGTNPVPEYSDPSTALGSPERNTGEFFGFTGAVTPFNAPYGPDEIISIGTGGSLTVHFDEPITNDASHPFGVDMLVFGNGFFRYDSAAGQADGFFGEGPFTISVSANGVDFVPLAGQYVDSFIPTLGFSDVTNPFGGPPGLLPTDFTQPMDPALTVADFVGRDLAEILAIYNGSGGGIPVDIAGSNLDAVSYVRIEAPFAKIEIDALAAVPEPATGVMALIGLVCVARGMRRGMQ